MTQKSSPVDNDPAHKVILVDGSSYLFRAFHALPPLTNSKGNPTGAVKGVINMIRSLKKGYPDSKIIVVFDAKGKTFRNDIYPEYKAHRPPMPDDLRVQIQPIHDIIKAMGLPLLVIDNVEADDVIGTLAHEATDQGIETLVSTGDKDMAQLVSEHVQLINTMNNEQLDVDGVQAKFGVPPEHIVDYLALMGDKVDNIPGVPKVGEKTAKALIAGLGSLEDVYSRLDDVATLDFRGAKSMKAKLEEHKEQAFLSKELATIKTDVELEWGLGDIKIDEPDNKKLLELYQECEFKTWIKELSTGEVEEPKQQQLPVDRSLYTNLSTEEALQEWLDKLDKAELYAIDTETTSLKYMEAEIVGISLAVAPNEACYIPLAHDYAGAPEQLDRDWVLQKMKPLLEDETPKKVGQNLKYDAHVLKNYDIELNGIAHDTMLESYVLNSTASKHNMDDLAKHYLGHECIDFESIAGKGAKQLTFNQIPVEQAGEYAAEDADITLRLHQVLWPQLEADESLLTLYKKVELPLVQVLTNMEYVGASVNADKLHQQSSEIEQRLQELERKAHDIAGEVFNLGSTKQLQAIFFEKLELPVIKKTPKGQPSTAEEVLVELSHDYELPKVILEHRGLAKLKNTYTDKLPLMINSKSQRVHTSYHQAVTATGRLSSSDPNLQNIPIRNEEGRKIRQAFEAPEGYTLVAADYSQIELRIMAHLSGDKGLLDAFKNGKDIHRATAAEIMEVDEADVDNEQRRRAKAVNFGLIYGMSAFGLARQLGIGRSEAQEYIDKYFDRYPGVKKYMESTRELAAKQGYVETLFGRRLYLPEINSRNGMRRQAAERTAINAPMQGTAADIIKRAMIKMHQWIQESAHDVHMIMQVHDELIFEVPDGQLDAVSAEIKSIMEAAADLDVPLLVDVGHGDNWQQAH
ncbi:DNA polymerase I [Bermanella marisrubri]|uniref:DNA polymerase I n=1 Tax=Bermanella marisrubri TaxID=207949 RepID=Q1MZ81_9GAMM|nr:DNA polymerase I [Bermanella marisrubri]EAT11252.1 DNA polymerase I [Oceanobacter sp. RED65] [Bermanella marisrubri]QIZ82735.1 DNA polymerase I [Bermanella marisrubri]